MRRLIGQGRQDGALAIEFAIFAPLVLLLIFAIVQFGVWVNASQGVHAAAREGARIGSLNTSSEALVSARVSQALEGVHGVGNEDVTVSVSPGPCVNRSGEQIVVEVAGSVDLAIPFWDSFTLPVNGRGVFRCE